LRTPETSKPSVLKAVMSMAPWPSALVRRLLMWQFRISMFEPEEVWVQYGLSCR